MPPKMDIPPSEERLTHLDGLNLMLHRCDQSSITLKPL